MTQIKVCILKLLIMQFSEIRKPVLTICFHRILHCFSFFCCCKFSIVTRVTIYALHMYLIHSCSFVICFLWWWYLPNDWTLTVVLSFKKNNLHSIFFVGQLEVLREKCLPFIPGICAVLLLALCTAVSACKDLCWKMEYYVYSSSLEYWLTYITHTVIWFLDFAPYIAPKTK